MYLNDRIVEVEERSLRSYFGANPKSETAIWNPDEIYDEKLIEMTEDAADKATEERERDMGW